MAAESQSKRARSEAAAGRTLFENAHIVTCIPQPALPASAAPQVACYSWMLVDNQRVLHVGEGSAPAEMREAADVVDLGGRLVLPGFFDSHCHVYYQGKMQQSLVLEGTRSIEELQEKLKRYRAEHPDVDVIEGNQWNQELLGRMPTRQDLDVVDVPVVLHRRCWHICCLNSSALERCGVVGGETVDGGEVDTDSSGKATGILREAAMETFLPPLRESGSKDQQLQLLRQGLDVFLRYGCTAVLTNDSVQLGGIATPWDRYQDLEAAGHLKQRVFLTVGWEELKETVQDKPTPIQGDWVTVYRVKLWSDGALGASTAAVEEPYSDDPAGANRGILQLDQAAMQRAIKLAQGAGFGVEAHTIGDRSARELLDAFDACGVKASDRYTLTHCQILKPELMRRMADVGAVASIQPQFNISDAEVAPRRLGAGSARLLSSYAWRSLRQAGVCLAGGSDAPVEVPNPLLGMYCAMVNDIHPHESLSFAEALEMYTLGGAYASRSEKQLGALQPGYFADFVVTSLKGGLAAAETPVVFQQASVEEVWVAGSRRFTSDAPGGSSRPASSTGDGPGKRGVLSFARRGPCPCCGPSWMRGRRVGGSASSRLS
eukprot:TRINITY_DN58885_c0_g1_i4.p1 TRINITY_DN58885_c0_g1~~TRINITY_DN58885_c0_g1_i4.p1  ORF type:complete len:602 (-),score=119.68 TRINITY_DN58885_c0_g1_i4:75-1880(-)